MCALCRHLTAESCHITYMWIECSYEDVALDMDRRRLAYVAGAWKR